MFGGANHLCLQLPPQSGTHIGLIVDDLFLLFLWWARLACTLAWRASPKASDSSLYIPLFLFILIFLNILVKGYLHYQLLFL